jgi:hypothetical protein
MTDDLISIHTCHAECPRPLCVAQRTIATQQEAIDELVVGLRAMSEYADQQQSGDRDDWAAGADHAYRDMEGQIDALLSKHGQRT